MAVVPALRREPSGDRPDYPRYLYKISPCPVPVTRLISERSLGDGEIFPRSIGTRKPYAYHRAKDVNLAQLAQNQSRFLNSQKSVRVGSKAYVPRTADFA